MPTQEERKVARYQNQSWLVRRWRDRYLLLIPYEAIRTYWYNGPHVDKDKEDYDPLSFSNCWGIACGMADMHRDYWYTWEETLGHLNITQEDLDKEDESNLS